MENQLFYEQHRTQGHSALLKNNSPPPRRGGGGCPVAKRAEDLRVTGAKVSGQDQKALRKRY